MCERERPRAPAVRLMFDDVRAAPAVLSFLRDTGGENSSFGSTEEWRGEDTGREVDREGEEGGPDPP